jgi:hypothetical protein
MKIKPILFSTSMVQLIDVEKDQHFRIRKGGAEWIRLSSLEKGLIHCATIQKPHIRQNVRWLLDSTFIYEILESK